jgi:hypothetical protein
MAPPFRNLGGSKWALELSLDVMPKLDRAGLGEINAVARPEAPGLALEIGAIERKVSVLVDEAVKGNRISKALTAALVW